MKLIVRIRNFIFLWRENKKETVNKDLNIENMLIVTKASYKTKGCLIRNLIASVIRKHRKENLYKIQDYSKAKLLYDSITPLDLSKVNKGIYVVKFSREEPVKGKRWCEYYINQSGNIDIYKVDEYDEKCKYWEIKDYKNENIFGNTIDEGSIRSFRFATKEEVSEFKNRQKQYRQKKKEIALKQKELNKLYSEL